jgi:hypothetical protein
MGIGLLFGASGGLGGRFVEKLLCVGLALFLNSRMGFGVIARSLVLYVSEGCKHYGFMMHLYLCGESIVSGGWSLGSSA